MGGPFDLLSPAEEAKVKAQQKQARIKEAQEQQRRMQKKTKSSGEASGSAPAAELQVPQAAATTELVPEGQQGPGKGAQVTPKLEKKTKGL